QPTGSLSARVATCIVLDACWTDVAPLVFFFLAEDGIRVLYVTGVQTCALPIYIPRRAAQWEIIERLVEEYFSGSSEAERRVRTQIGRASCRERGWNSGVARSFKISKLLGSNNVSRISVRTSLGTDLFCRTGC